MIRQILTTTDYSLFRRLKGNRSVLPKRKKEVIDSIKKYGWLSMPIVVNEKMEIIDGQARFEALKELGMPIEYYIVPGLTIDDCRIINEIWTKWKTENYVESYAEMGTEDYNRVKYLMNYYDVPLNVIISAKNNRTGHGKNGGRDFKKMRDGRMTFSESDYIYVSRIMNIYKRYRMAFNRFGGRTNTKDNVIFYLIQYGDRGGKIDHDRVIESLMTCDPQTIYNTGFDRLLESVQNAYNFNKAKKNRIYVYEEYRVEKI